MTSRFTSRSAGLIHVGAAVSSGCWIGLSATVRSCRYGVLIRAGCLLGLTRCAGSAAHKAGSYLVVQPCEPDRRPRGAAIVVGPVLTRGDVEAVASWLEDGDLDAEQLDRRLRVQPIGRRS